MPPAFRHVLPAARRFAPGLGVAVLVAISATFLSEHYGGPVMLFALLLGMAFNFLPKEARFGAGIDFATKFVLRLGVALLGLQITVGQVASLGWKAPVVTAAGVLITILAGYFLARSFRLDSRFGLLTGGAVAICGASAALAIASVLPKHDKAERDTIFTVIGVTTLSTAAMVAYPVILHALGLSNLQSGLVIGATIHDVAQVVGAGYSVSAEAGDAATVIKLLRVALLVPVVAVLAMIYAGSAGGNGRRRAGLLPPWFLVAFVALAIVASLGWVPRAVAETTQQASRWCLVTAIAALGMKTSLAALGTLGWRPVALMVAETLILGLLVLALLA